MPVRSNILPCVNSADVVSQVRPTAELLRGLDRTHPQILLEAGVDPDLYHKGNIFRSAIETIRGSQAASQTTPREQFVHSILAAMQHRGHLVAATKTSIGQRWDFSVEMDAHPRRKAAIEVKGGEGNSLNLSNPPPEVQEFIIWSHLDGSIQHNPAHGARSVLSRIVADIIKAPKKIDALVVRDRICGTEARPCPKYAGADYPEFGPAPDIFLFPSVTPIFGRTMHPPVHTEATCLFPFRLLDFFGVPVEDRSRHIHEVDIRLYVEGDVTMREVTVWQSGAIQFQNSSRVQVR